ncbi:hypothetical protein HanIR_Chr03g0106031 [Helianthus annuus]|nr:hypothetical protein HanIR_Chr03g0106031 [Helianthus annuus]
MATTLPLLQGLPLQTRHTFPWNSNRSYNSGTRIPRDSGKNPPPLTRKLNWVSSESDSGEGIRSFRSPERVKATPSGRKPSYHFVYHFVW